MASVLPKIKMFIFISIISLLINLSIVAVAYGMENTTNIDTGETDTTINYEENDINTTAMDLIVASGTSFLPFVDLINIATLDLTSIPLVMVFYALITSLLGALKLYLLVVIVLNVIPTVNV